MTTSADAAPAAGSRHGGHLPAAGRRGVLAVVLGVALALAGAAVAHGLARGWLLVVLVPAQLLLAVTWSALVAVPDRLAGVVLPTAAAVAADVLLTVRHGPVLGALAGVLGVAVVASVLGQLVRRDRREVTDVLAAQLSAILLAGMIAVLAAVRGAPAGREAASTGLLALACALAAGGALDVLGRRVWLGPSSAGRSLVGVLAALGAGAGVGAGLHGGEGLVLGVVAAALGVLGDAVVAVAAGSRRIGRLLGAVLPFALAGPGLYVVERVLFG